MLQHVYFLEVSPRSPPESSNEKLKDEQLKEDGRSMCFCGVIIFLWH